MSKKSFPFFLFICGALAPFSALRAADAMANAPVVAAGTVTEVRESGAKKYIGKLDATKCVSLVARVPGKLEKIFCKEGDFVKEGDLLFQLEDTTYIAALKRAEAKLEQAAAQIKQAAAQIKQADATLEYARINHQRQEDLATVSSKKELDQSRRDLSLAEAAKASAEGAMAAALAAKSAAEAELLDARNNLSYTKIYADFTGKVGKATFSSGNYVTPASGPLATLLRYDPIYVCFAISEPDYISMFGTSEVFQKEGRIRIRLSDRSLYPKVGKVAFLDNKVNTTTGTIMVWTVMDNSEMRLTPGAIVDVLVTKQRKDSIPAVPISAVFTGKDGHYVWGITEKGMSVIRPVVIGEAVGDYQTVRRGLKPGERIIVSGGHKIMRSGIPLRIVPDRSSGENITDASK